MRLIRRLSIISGGETRVDRRYICLPIILIYPGILWRELKWTMFVYFVVTWCILWLFGIFVVIFLSILL
jgi:hypothetical protein